MEKEKKKKEKQLSKQEIGFEAPRKTSLALFFLFEVSMSGLRPFRAFFVSQYDTKLLFCTQKSFEAPLTRVGCPVEGIVQQRKEKW